VVGGGYSSPESGPVPVVWKDGVMTLLPTLGGRGLATDVNANGVIVGWVDTDSATAPAVWRNGQLSVLPSLREFGGEATAIDDDGRISGFSRGYDADNLPTEWVGDVARPLPVSFGEDYIGVLGVNKSGRGRTSGYIIQRQFLDTGESYLITVAVGWQDGQFRTLQRPNGQGNSFANDVNAQGLYVGYSMDSGGYYVPTVWNDEGASELPHEAGRSWIAIGANESGTVVGVDYTDPFKPVPLVWQTADSPQIAMASVVAQRGTSVALTAQLFRAGQPVANQQVVYRVQGRKVGSATTDAQGKASINYRVPARAAGSLDVQAIAGLAGSTSFMRKIEIDRLSTTAGVAPSKVQRGRWVTLKASLRSTHANRPLAKQKLHFVIDGSVVGTARTDDSGFAKLRYLAPADLSLGSHLIEARYAGDKIFRSNIGRASLGVVR
jgi:hypothetical protein